MKVGWGEIRDEVQVRRWDMEFPVVVWAHSVCFDVTRRRHASEYLGVSLYVSANAGLCQTS